MAARSSGRIVFWVFAFFLCAQNWKDLKDQPAGGGGGGGNFAHAETLCSVCAALLRSTLVCVYFLKKMCLSVIGLGRPRVSGVVRFDRGDPGL